MEETYEFLKRTEVNYVSTINGNTPSCRPFGAPVLYNDKIYVLTSKDKMVSNQIALNNNVCIVAYDNQNWIRINCKLIDDSNNNDVKEDFLQAFPSLSQDGYSLENPNMQVLYMSEVKSIIYDESGNIASEYIF